MAKADLGRGRTIGFAIKSRENHEYIPMTEHDQSKKFADKTAATANKAFATVEKSARAVEQGSSVSLENIRAFNLKMIGMARANVEAALDLSQQIATAGAIGYRRTLDDARAQAIRDAERTEQGAGGTRSQDRPEKVPRQ